MPYPFLGGTSLNTITRNGRTLRYLRIKVGPQKDRYVHQLVAEAMLGRDLRADEEVDHKDTDTLNNRWTNLEVKTVSAHAKVTRTRATQRRLAAQRQAGEAALAEEKAAQRLDECLARAAADAVDED